MRYLLIAILFSITVFAQAQEEEKNYEFSGYIKNLQTFITFNNPNGDNNLLLDNLFHHRLNFEWFPSDKFTFKAGMRNRLFTGASTKTVDPSGNLIYGDLIDAGANDYLDLSALWLNNLNAVGHSVLDRFYMQYTNDEWEVRLGRQRINWGINSVWNPNDLFNAFSFTDFDYEERPGSDALLVRKYFNYISSIEVAIKVFDTWENAAMGALWKFNKWNYDFQLLGAYVAEDIVAGAGWAGNISNASFKGEASYFIPSDSNDKTSFVLSTGFDYLFENGVYTGVGYLYNEEGSSNAAITELFTFQLSAKNLYPYKHAVFASINNEFNPIISGGGAIIFTPNASFPLFVSPSISVSISDNWDLYLGAQLVWSKFDDSYISPLSAGFIRFKYSY